MQLICDDRESRVITALRSVYGGLGDALLVLRITSGDFVISCEGVCVAIIERKTWADLAASFADGRVKNISKLRDRRTETNCKIIYLIEGVANPSPDTMFGSIPAKNCIAHLDHLMFRDNVHIMYSADVNGSAELLTRLVNTYQRLHIKQLRRRNREAREANIKPCVLGSAEPAALAATQPADASAQSTMNAATTRTMLTRSRTVLPTSLTYLMAIAGVGLQTAKILHAHGVTLYDVVNWPIKRELMLQLGLPKLKRAVLTMDKFHARLTGVTMLKLKEAVNIVSTVPGVSKQTAKLVIARFSLQYIIFAPEEGVVANLCTVSRGKNNITVKLAQKITAELRQITAVA